MKMDSTGTGTPAPPLCETTIKSPHEALPTQRSGILGAALPGTHLL